MFCLPTSSIYVMENALDPPPPWSRSDWHHLLSKTPHGGAFFFSPMDLSRSHGLLLEIFHLSTGGWVVEPTSLPWEFSPTQGVKMINRFWTTSKAHERWHVRFSMLGYTKEIDFKSDLTTGVHIFYIYIFIIYIQYAIIYLVLIGYGPSLWRNKKSCRSIYSFQDKQNKGPCDMKCILALHCKHYFLVRM